MGIEDDRDPGAVAERTSRDPEMARVLFIVNRDHPELLASLRQEFAAQEAAGLAAIFSDRRQGPGPSNPAPHAYNDYRRDRQRNVCGAGQS